MSTHDRHLRQNGILTWFGIGTAIMISPTVKRKNLLPFRASSFLFSSPEQCSWRAIVLPLASAAATALDSASTNVKVFVKNF